MAKTTKQSKKKWARGEGKWPRLKADLQGVIDEYECTSLKALLRAVGLNTGGDQYQRLRDMAVTLNVELPHGTPGPAQKYATAADSGKAPELTDAEAAAAEAAVEEVRHEKRLDDSGGRQVDILRRQIKKLHRVIEKHQTDQEMVLDAIEQTVQARDPVPVHMPRENKRRGTAGDRRKAREHLLMPCISDVHVGELILYEETGGLGQYDWPTFLRRYEAYKEAFYVILNDILRRAMPIRRAVLSIHGDLGTNENIYPGQPFHIDMLAFDQLFEGADYISSLLLYVASMVEHLELHFVPGNHGRFQNSTLNLDMVMHKIITRSIAAQPNISVYNSKTHFAAWRIDEGSGHIPFPDDCHEEHDFFLIHGDSVKQYLDQPAYGMCRSVQRYAAMCGVPFKYAIYGHFHQLGRFGHGHVWSNGAWPGGGEYSVKKFQSAAEPAQSVFVLDSKYGIVMDYPIRFGEPSARLTLEADGHVYTPYDGIETDAIAEVGETEAA